MARRKKSDWLDQALGKACGHIMNEAARGIGKRIRTALETPKQTALPRTAPTGAEPKSPTINVFQGPTQVVVQRKRDHSPARKGRAKRPDKFTDAVDVEYEIKPRSTGSGQGGKP